MTQVTTGTTGSRDAAVSRPPDAEGGVTCVSFLPGGVRIEARHAETVLGAAMRSGFHYRFGCRRGGCGICKVRLILGEVRYERPIASTVLSEEEKAVGVCLSCRAIPITDIIVELQEGDRLRQVSPFGLKLPGH
jgi:CDP-4-dehydro-6-deoxyglucose reductase